ncbi:MAG: DUF1330 domain-containing protein [Pseudomonadota bacterium]
MSVYVVAQLSFKNEARYRAYQRDFPAVFASSGGEVVVADERPELLEGDWYGDKLVVLKFPSRTSAMAFMQSAPYQTISEDRRAGAETVSLLVAGL